ncbi:Small-conductance mechanosensitive channel [Enhygromyxa salina]|uniref:Small-conductance mechanosensitive channel n=1 Tax=Enhygromyxa salina TaxID=215803 RepID=A0A2S9XMF0_9BACT|nr:mechanosensitive ion channel family protein [Enhygromyxa salina]PRP94058.1 Small-conductance mechanosensitive channel [Enhygromyxa salina]
MDTQLLQVGEFELPVAARAPLDALLEKLDGWATTAVEMLPNFVLAAIVVIAFGIAARYAGRWAQRALDRTTNKEVLSALIGNVTRVVVVVAGVSVALSLLHLDKAVTSLLAGVGVVGLALGFAFQDIAANFMSGALMAFRGSIEPGDIIEVNGHTGTVEEVQLRRTVLRTFDGLSVVVPNKDIYQDTVVHFTRTTERRVDVSLGVAYSDDLERTREVLIAALEPATWRDQARDVEVFFTGFGDSSINFDVRVWLEIPGQFGYLDARSEMIIVIKKALDEAGMSIPFPIRTLDFGASAVGGDSLDVTPIQIARERAGEARPIVESKAS